MLFCRLTAPAMLFSLLLLQICSSLASSAEMPTWGGGAESLCSCAWLPRAVGGGWTSSLAWRLLAGITALQRSSCCPPAGPLASGPGCQPAGRGGSLAGSQLTVPELSAGRQARQGRDPCPRTGPWPGHWDRAKLLTATIVTRGLL